MADDVHKQRWRRQAASGPDARVSFRAGSREVGAREDVNQLRAADKQQSREHGAAGEQRAGGG